MAARLKSRPSPLRLSIRSVQATHSTPAYWRPCMRAARSTSKASPRQTPTLSATRSPSPPRQPLSPFRARAPTRPGAANSPRDTCTFSDEERIAEPILAARAINKRNAVHVARHAPRCTQDGIAGRRVPLHGRAEARIKIRLAPREQAEFQRRAYRADLRSGKSRNVGVGLGCAMRQARQDDRSCLPARTGADLPSPHNLAITQIHLERTLAPSRKQKVTCRRINDAEHRRAMAYQGDIDGEIWTTVDELARAIKRIDQQECIAALRNDAERGILLRHAWQVGHLPKIGRAHV